MPGKLSDSQLEELLAAPEIGVLCTVDAAGKPEGSPIWFEASNGTIHVHVDRASKKARNVRGNPNVSLTVDTRTVPYRGVVLRGVAREREFDQAMARRVAVRYLGAEVAESYLAATAGSYAESVLLEITVQSRHTWDYGQGF